MGTIANAVHALKHTPSMHMLMHNITGFESTREWIKHHIKLFIHEQPEERCPTRTMTIPIPHCQKEYDFQTRAMIHNLTHTYIHHTLKSHRQEACNKYNHESS